MSGSEQQHTTTDILPLVRTPVGPLVVDAVLDLLTGSETRRAHLCAPAAHDGAGQHRLGRGSKRRRRRRALLLLLALCSLFYLLARLRRGASAGTGTGDTARGSRGDDAFGNERRAGDSSSRTAEGQRRRITGTGQTAAQEANYVRLRDLIDSKRSAFDDLRLFLGGERLALDVDALELEDGEGEGASGEMNDDEDDEAEEASGARGVRRAPSARSAPPPGLLPPVTAVVLHFARPRALSLVLRHLSRHAFIREIIVWNNDPFASSNALNFTAPPPREAREAQEDEEQALEGGGLDVLDVEQALAPGSDTGREPPPPLVRVLNAPANVRDLGKYHACALAQHAHCFFADDDWLNLQLDAAYTKYVDCCAGAAGVVVDAAGQGGNAQEGGGPGDEEGLRGIISASTLPIIHLQHQLWRFDNPKIDLHTGFTWLGTGAFAPRALARRFLSQLSAVPSPPPTTTTDEHKAAVLTPLSKQALLDCDALFPLWANSYPEQMVAQLVQIDVENAPSKWAGKGSDEQWATVYSNVLDGVRRLFDALASQDPALLPDPFPLAPAASRSDARAPCANDACLFITSLSPFPRADSLSYDDSPPPDAVHDADSGAWSWRRYLHKRRTGEAVHRAGWPASLFAGSFDPWSLAHLTEHEDRFMRHPEGWPRDDWWLQKGSWHLAVDGKQDTCWQSWTAPVKGDYFGLRLVRPRTLHSLRIWGSRDLVNLRSADNVAALSSEEADEVWAVETMSLLDDDAATYRLGARWTPRTFVASPRFYASNADAIRVSVALAPLAQGHDRPVSALRIVSQGTKTRRLLVCAMEIDKWLV